MPSLRATFSILALALSAVSHPGHSADGDSSSAIHDRSCKPIVKRQITGSGGEGAAPSGQQSSASAAGYTCDASTCKLPTCQCASTSPPGGIAPADTPQFITFTADDAIQIYTTNTMNGFLANRKNPNGCAPKMTYFTSLNYTNYSMVTDWYVAGNEIADHTMTHVGDAPQNEINGNIIALNSFAGIPISEIQGFRAPFLNYTAATMQHLFDAGFTYDSSTTSATPADHPDTDAFWPYTLDNGFANDCLAVEGICQGKLKLKGMWEIPMYAVYGNGTTIGLMDPWLDSPDTNMVLNMLKDTFLTHYNGNRQPFGLYSHPIHLAVGYPGIPDPVAQIKLVNDFLDWVQAFQNVWIVSNAQMLEWLKNPVPNSQITSVEALGCTTPSVSDKICNGMYPNEIGLLENCPFVDFPWTTCYGCPTEPPTPSNPNPPQATTSGTRFRIPQNCTTPFWDPIGNKCLCTGSQCQFTTQTRPLGNYTGGGSGASSAASGSATASIYTPFSDAGWGGKQMVLTGLWGGLATAAAVGFMMMRQ